MRAYKTLTRELLTLAAGRFVAREFRKRCPACPQPPPAVSQHLAQLAPPGQCYGYDLLVWVGLARYQRRVIQAAPALRSVLARGYALHLDATCEQDLLRRVTSAWHDFQALQPPAAAVRRLTHR